MITGSFVDEVLGAQALSDFLPLIYYVLGIAVYGIFVWHFYRFLARRDIFHLEWKKLKSFKEGLLDFFSIIIYIFEYVFLFPLITFIWFAVLATFLIFLSKEAPVETVLLVTMAIVAATRITAYYSEDLSKDLAKMLPFALLGVFLIDPSFFDWATTLAKLNAVPDYFYKVVQFGLFTIVLEFGLRIGFSVVRIFIPADADDE